MDNFGPPFSIITDNTILPDTTGVDPKYNKIDEAPPGTIELHPPGVETIERESWKIEQQYSAPETEPSKTPKRSEGGTKEKRKREDSSYTPDRKASRDEAKSKEKHSKDKKADKKEKKKKKDKDKEEKESKKAKKHKRDKGEKHKENKSSAVSAKTTPDKTATPEVEQNTPEMVEPPAEAGVPDPFDSTEETLELNESNAQVEEPEDSNALDNSFIDLHPEGDTNLTERNDDDLAANDGIIDLYDNLDLDLNTEITKDFGMTEDEFLQLPEPSKWEKDEEVPQKQPEASTEPAATADPTPDSDKVTNEVIKRAENALFTKSFVAVKPITIESSGSSKSRSNEPTSPLLSAVAKSESRSQSLKITVASDETSKVQERRVSVSTSAQSSPKKRLSIKDRLGAKVGADGLSKRRSSEAKEKRDRGRRRSKSKSGGDKRRSTDKQKPVAEKHRSGDKVVQPQVQPQKPKQRSTSDRRRSSTEKPKRRSRSPNRQRQDRPKQEDRPARVKQDSSSSSRQKQEPRPDHSRSQRRPESNAPARSREPVGSRDRGRRRTPTPQRNLARRDDRDRRDDRGRRDEPAAKKRSRTPDNSAKKKPKLDEVDSKKHNENSSDSSSSSSSSTGDSQDHKRKKKEKKKKSKKKSKAKKEKKKKKSRE